MNTTAEYLTVNQAAEQLQVRPLTVRAWIRRHLLKSVRIGRTVRIHKSDLEAAIRPDYN